MENPAEEKVKLEEKFCIQENDNHSCDASSRSSTTNPPVRDVWGRKIEYLLSMIGYAVGIGNIQRFPYLVAKNGGGAFLLPYTFFLVVGGIPLYYLEVCLGQFSGQSPILVWRICPLLMGIGYLMCIVSGICSWYYNTLIAWTLYYLVNSFDSVLPWSSCDNWWNGPDCFNSAPSNATNGTTVYNNSSAVILGHSTVRSSSQFWQHNVLRMSGGLHEMGHLQWHMVLALLAAWVLVFLCLAKGVRSLGKVVYVTALLPYVLYVVFLVRALILPGAYEGILYYLTPRFDKILDPQVWFSASIQVFYSLGPVWGGVITMSSYTKFHDNCLRTAMIVSIVDGMTCFIFGFAVFATLGFMAHDLDVSVAEIANSDPGLIFITYPEVISKFPFPQVWAVLFWIMMLTMGLDTQFGVFETISSGIIDAFPTHLAKRKTLVVAIVAAVFFLSGLPLATNGGIYIYQLCDWYVAAFCMMLCAFLETVVVGWIYGAERFSRDVELMTGSPVPVVIRICWCVVTPVTLFTIFVLILKTYAPPTYNGYVYPDYGVSIGVFIGLLPVIPIPIFMVYQIARRKGSLWERIKSSVRPSSSWLPKEQKYREYYRSREEIQYGSFLNRVKINLFGTGFTIKKDLQGTSES